MKPIAAQSRSTTIHRLDFRKLQSVSSKDSCHALPGGKVESSAGGHAYEDSDGTLRRKALAAATAVLAGLAF